jgi:hypothetical protein
VVSSDNITSHHLTSDKIEGFVEYSRWMWHLLVSQPHKANVKYETDEPFRCTSHLFSENVCFLCDVRSVICFSSEAFVIGVSDKRVLLIGALFTLFRNYAYAYLCLERSPPFSVDVIIIYATIVTLIHSL